MNELLDQLAEAIRENIEVIGGDPNDLGQVKSFIKGCDFETKLATKVVELDAE